ncbi:asparagine synthase (glutamine-hydrolyzing) [Amylibacter sp. IMCC11727]|uniref:asparagine synthase (glutamine-hydrolyzing) n=1 Tax=Amylibacter sp. IMCC11727 TaxID=3039851 RepID=UPI00244E0D79|nr:asparagine synthase (glutamine-hydrolyzing) [Amylibacter sp. IMCC11727]WGI23087.1 asparagine synthase (glutamine-hydrolyzing) [Amylibacter sp. IMCC11727]
MCGFVTIVRRNAPVTLAELQTAMEALVHRGPDAVDYHIETLNVPGGQVSIGMGHARLSILDPNPRANQPYKTAKSIMVYNGEVFNFQALKSELTAAGHQFATTGDTELLCSLIETVGRDALKRLNGQWAFVHADKQKSKILAARDRFGKKPFFFTKNDQQFVAASTCQAVALASKSALRFDHSYLNSFLHFESTLLHEERTPYVGISQLKPSHSLELDLGEWHFETVPYFDMTEHVAQSDLKPAHLPDLLVDAVVSRMVSDRPVSLLLSGGIDSSLILSILHAQDMMDNVTCFIGDSGKTEDAQYAQACVDQLGLSAKTIKIETDKTAFDQFLHLCKNQEAPFANHGMMSMSAMYRAIAETDCKVVLDGTGGDEVFGGYWDRQFPLALRAALKSGNLPWIGSFLRSNGSDWRRIARAFKQMIQPPSQYVPPSVLKYAHKKTASSGCPLADGRLSFDEALAQDLIGGRMSDWLWQNDRNAMSFGLEARSPLMDFRLSAYCNTGYAHKFQGNFNKMELRRAFSHFHELPTQWRSDKQGFNWQSQNFREHNKRQLTDLIAESRSLSTVLDRDRLLHDCQTDPTIIQSHVFERAFTLAGVEQSLSVTV